MRLFFKVVSYSFHPLLVPVGGTMAYFAFTPKYSPAEEQSSTLLPIFILTVIIPVITYLILKNIGLIQSIFLPTLKERRYPLYISVLLFLMVVYKIIPNNYIAELHYYFLGLIAATMASLLLLFMNFKASIHLMGMGSMVMYLTCLSVHFEINITMVLSILILLTGLVATSRIYLKAHSKPELIIGALIGLVSQLLTVKFWL